MNINLLANKQVRFSIGVSKEELEVLIEGLKRVAEPEVDYDHDSRVLIARECLAKVASFRKIYML